MKKQLIKTLFLLLSSSLYLGTSVNITEAFLDNDLWLNLYKNLDEWLDDFEEKMYVYELSEQDKQDISKSVNKILFNKWIWDCLIDWVSPTTFGDIADWKIEILLNNMKEECYNPETWEYNTKRVWNIINEVNNIKQYYLNKSKTKSNAIFNVSRIWMYSDWSIDNSPYDIIKDINDINDIIFSNPIEYDSEDLNFLKNYQNKPLIWPLWNNLWWNNWDSNNWNSNNNSNDSNSDNSDSNDSSNSDNWWEIYIDDQDNSSNTPDWNNYYCPTDESWLDNDSIDWLIWSIDWGNNWNWDTFNYWTGWHSPLPDTNLINIPSLLSSNFNSEMIANWISPYEQITDKNIWPCNEYFCITVDFIVRNQRALSYSSDHSIENIIKTSNKHLKKAVNTSLVQSKMTTNNFEIALRDLNLPEMFHMWIQVSYKSPPILNINELPWDTVKNMLKEKYKNLWLNYDEPNNLNKYLQNIKKMKSIILTTENPTNIAVKINNQLDEVLKLRSKMLDYNKEFIDKNINNNILKDFETQFREISQFNINIFDYITHLDWLIKKLKEIPTNTW